MEVSALSSPKASYYMESLNFNLTHTKETQKTSDSQAVTYEKTEISAEYSFYSFEKSGRNVEAKQQGEIPKLSDAAETARLREKIHQEVISQVKDFMAAFFVDNPEAAEQVSKGEIPDYFNEENTARRILDIYMPYYTEGEDKQAFVERAKGIIDQAYGDVAGLVGELPDLVQRTRELIMDVLDKFAAGDDISDFMGYTVGGPVE